MGDVFESIGHGFCLVAPRGYAVVETAPGNFSLVADRCLAFVHGRRVYSLQMMPLSAEAEVPPGAGHVSHVTARPWPCPSRG